MWVKVRRMWRHLTETQKEVVEVLHSGEVIHSGGGYFYTDSGREFQYRTIKILLDRRVVGYTDGYEQDLQLTPEGQQLAKYNLNGESNETAPH